VRAYCVRWVDEKGWSVTLVVFVAPTPPDKDAFRD
jgi:hypothetical protein